MSGTVPAAVSSDLIDGFTLGVLGALAGSSLGKSIFMFGILMGVVGALMLKPREPGST